MTLPAYCQPTAYRSLSDQLVHIESFEGLARAACAIAAHKDGCLESDETIESLNALVHAVRSRTTSDSQDTLLAHLHDVLFDVLEFSGNVDDYYAPVNSYLPSVVASRKGIPITLSLVYGYVASGLGLNVHGVNAPGHFMVAVETREGDQTSLMFVDPFYGGTLLSLPEAFERIAQATGTSVEPHPQLLARASHQAWLSRMVLNLTAIFARAGRERDLYAMQELLDLLEQKHVA